VIRIVLAGGYDTRNLGDHAMLVVLRREFVARFGAADITLLSRHPDAELDRAYGVRSIPNLDHASREAARGRWFRGLNGEADTAHLRDVAEAVEQADLLVIGGGRMLVDYTHGFLRGHLAYFAQLTVLARFLGTPMMLYAQSLEPLATESGAEHLRFLAANAASITVREEASRRVLEDLGVGPERARVVPDPAFGLGLEPPYRGPKLPRLPRDGRPLLAVNVRSYAWRDGDVDGFETRLAALLDRIRRELGAHLLFVPQMTYDVDTAETDDRAVARRVAGRMREGDGLLFAEARLDVAETLGVYRHASALLSMRRHGMLFAASQGVPVIPLSAERNTHYTVRALGAEAHCVALDAGDEAVATVRAVLRDAEARGRAAAARVAAEAPRVARYADEVERVLGAGRAAPRTGRPAPAAARP